MDDTLNKWSQFEGCRNTTKDIDVLSMIEKGELDPNAFTKYGCTLLIHFIRMDNLLSIILNSSKNIG